MPISSQIPYKMSVNAKGQENLQNFAIGTSISISEVMDTVKFGLFQVLLSLGLSMALMPYSMEFLLLSILQLLPECMWRASNPITDVTEISVWMGMAVTAPIWGFLSDRMGRRRIIIVAVIGHISLTICLVFSPSSEVFISIMFLRGCFLSCLLQCYVLLSEYCPSNYRGGFIAINHMLCMCGGLFVMMCSQEFMEMPQDWKSLVIFTIIPSILFTMAFYWIPESPFYYCSVGNTKETKKCFIKLAYLNGKGGTLDAVDITNRGSAHFTSPLSWSSMWRVCDLVLGSGNLSIPIVVWTLWFLAGMVNSGNTMTSLQILKSLEACHNKLQNISQEEISLGVNISISSQCFSNSEYECFVLDTVAAIPIVLFIAVSIDAIGRKGAYLTVTGLLSISVLPLVIRNCEITRTWRYILLFCAKGASVGWYTVNIIYTLENYPTIVRSTSLGAAYSIGCLGAMTTLLIKTYLITYSITLGMFAYYSVGVVGFIISIYLPNETKGTSLSSFMDLSPPVEPVSIQYIPTNCAEKNEQQDEREMLMKSGVDPEKPYGGINSGGS